MTTRTIIVPAAVQPTAQYLCEGLAGPAGGNMFVTGLSPTGDEPATHYISAGGISSEMAALLPCKTYTTNAEGETEFTETPGMPEVVPVLAAKVEVQVTAEQIGALFAAIDVSDQGPHEAMARLGLRIVNTPMELA
jgi:hypothetical protein